MPTRLALLDLNSPDAVAEFLLGTSERYEYFPPARAVQLSFALEVF